MNKLLIFVLISILMLSSSMAVVYADDEYDDDYDHKQEYFDRRCQEHGFDFAIAAWHFKHGVYNLIFDIDDFLTSVTGDDMTADWTSDPAADGVLSVERPHLTFFEHPGGTSGTIDKSGDAIKFVMFCGNAEPIPEFTTLTAGIALAGAGYYMYRKRRAGKR